MLILLANNLALREFSQLFGAVTGLFCVAATSERVREFPRRCFQTVSDALCRGEPGKRKY
jgi:hypothetical protein